MTDAESPEDKLFEEAFDLLIRLKNDPANPVTHELLRNWRARSAAHEAVWSEAVAIHSMANKVVRKRHAKEHKTSGVSRRTLLLGIGATAIVSGSSLMFGPGLLLQARADHLTATAETRRITLPDGSKITLGPDSAIRSAMNMDARRVELLAGMAYFEVEPDSMRPFEVVAGGLVVTVVGTAFDLSMDADTTSVAVNHGLVAVRIGITAPGENLSAARWLSVDQRTGAVERGVREAGQVAAWRDGVLVAQGETVAAVVARIARWKVGRVVIADPGLGSLRISGVYNLDKPLNALRAVVGPHGGKVYQVTPWLTVISQI